MKKNKLNDAKLVLDGLHMAYEHRINPDDVADDMFELIADQKISDADMIPYLLSYATLLMGITANLHSKISMRLDTIKERMEQSLDGDDKSGIQEWKKIKQLCIRTNRIQKKIHKLNFDVYDNYIDSL